MLVVLILFHLGEMAGQCRVDTLIQIQERDTISILLEVSDLTNDDLSDPGQGVCGICVNFEHEFLGDLQIQLISPAGQSVQLTGPEGVFGLTQFTEWDVCFVRSSDVAVPDPGFTDRWSNNQLWGAFAGTYTGSYYPFFGSLEDFNMGSANGTWRLRFEDRTIFYEGLIKGYELIFCDSSGIECNPCDPGELVLNASQDSFCVEDSILLLDVLSDYRVREDSQSYTTQVYLTNASGRILGRGTNYDLSGAPPGNYRICGLSYFKPHDTLIPIVGDNWLEFQNEVRRGDKAVCLRYSNCLDIFIDDGPDTIVYESVLCAGDTLFFKDTLYTQRGQFVYRQTHSEICDSFFRIDIETVNLQAAISSSDTLTCSKDSVLLVGQDLGLNLNYAQRWRSDSSSETLSFSDTLVVYQPGTYWYILSKDGCTDSISVNIHKDSMVPSLRIAGDTITCADTTAELIGVTDANMPQFQWEINGMQIGSAQTLQTNSSGLYKLTIIDQNGCSASGEFLVTMDTLVPSVTIKSDTIDCYNDSIDIGLSSTGPLERIVWTGPAGLLDSVSNVTVGQSGFYTYEVTGQNGCILIDSIEVVSDLDTPEIVIELDTLDCRNSQVNIFLRDADSSEIEWFEGTSLRDSGISTVISIAGIYKVRVTGDNGCSGERTFDIIEEIDAVGVVGYADSLDCRNDSVRIWLSSVLPIQIDSWRLPDGTAIIGDTIFTRQPGLHYVQYAGPSGCIYIDSVLVRDLGEELNISVEGDTLNCVRTTSVLNAFSSGSDISYQWIFNGDTISRSDSAVVNDPGVVILHASDSAGCTFTDTLRIQIDTSSPVYQLSGIDTITCNKPQIQVVLNGSDLDRVIWERSGMTIGESDSLRVSEEGQFKVVVQGRNGCRDSSVFNVEIDTVSPNLVVESDTLTCSDPSVFIRSVGGDLNWEYTWRGPNGDSSTGNQYFISEPGLYHLDVVDPRNGCSSTFRHEVIIDTIRPSVEVGDTTLSCLVDSILLELAINTDWQYISWSDNFGMIATGPSVTLTSSGVYSVEVTGRNGCVTVDTFSILEDDEAPGATILGGNLNCRDSSVVLTATAGINLARFEWYMNGVFVSSDSSISVSESGVYKLFMEGNNGCVDTLDYSVMSDTVKPVFSLSKSGDLGCNGDSVMVAIMLDTASLEDYSVMWLWPSGELDSLSGLGISTDQKGGYVVDIENIRNGCSAIDSIQIDLSTTGPHLDSVELLLPTCSGDSDGVVTIVGIQGGAEPYQIDFDGSGPDTILQFEGLGAGSYDLRIEDAGGCVLDTFIILPDGDRIFVELGRDTTINLGDTLMIMPMRISDTANVNDYNWEPEELLSPQGAFSTFVHPKSFTIFRLTITSESGCTAFDEITVDVKNEVTVFVPNVISPNQDGINDYLEVFLGRGTERVISIDVFDRWGEHVFSAAPGQEKWDGTFNDEICPNGVYVYKIALLSKSGETFQYMGDVTLFR